MSPLVNRLDTSSGSGRSTKPSPSHPDLRRVWSELSDFSGGAGARPAEESVPAASWAEPAEPAAAGYVLPAELLHGIEAVVTPTSPQIRSAAVSSVLEEIYRTVEWLHSGEMGQEELASLAQVLAAARGHEARMTAHNAEV